MNIPSLAILFGLGTAELAAIGVVALLIFGRRLPEVGRNLGKGLVEFKKGLRNVQDEIESAGNEDDTASADGTSSDKTPPTDTSQYGPSNNN